MHKALHTLLSALLNKRYIGGRHTPEQKLIRAKIKWLPPNEQRLLHKEYAVFVREEYILRTKKRTGKDYDWHISLNPRKLKELYELMETDQNENRSFL